MVIPSRKDLLRIITLVVEKVFGALINTEKSFN